MNRSTFMLGLALATCLTLGVAQSAAAQNYEFIAQDLNENRHGYTVLRVWGSDYQMGYAMGVALAPDILIVSDEVLSGLGWYYYLVRWSIAGTRWLEEGIEEELDGIVDGVREVYPDAYLDVLDLKILNTFSDWAYLFACRSHSCWGSRVEEGVSTLSTRRLDYGTPFAGALHHVVVARDPDDGSTRWVNFAWPGYVTAITAVNDQGTLAALHDFNSSASLSGAVPRSVAVRYLLTQVGSLPLDEHLAFAAQALASMQVATRSFINYFVPQGRGGVFTCPRGGPCEELRLPQEDFFDGEVLITTNQQTDGVTPPEDDEFMTAYYHEGQVKDLESHFSVMGTEGLHLLSLEVRGPQDMTMWFHGRGRDDRLELSWCDLYPDTCDSPQPY